MFKAYLVINVLILPTSVYAYIDPGLKGMFLHIMATIIGFGVFYFKRIKNFIFKKKDKDSD